MHKLLRFLIKRRLQIQTSITGSATPTTPTPEPVFPVLPVALGVTAAVIVVTAVVVGVLYAKGVICKYKFLL